jgi:hypothetical protein
MTIHRQGISVTLPVGQALDRVKKVLFQPFDIGKWFVIGFCAWIAYLGEGGGLNTGFNYGGHHGQGGQSPRAVFENARDYVVHNIGWIAPLAVGLIIVILVMWLVVLWLSSRGRFMFLHCVALNAAEVRVPWLKFASEANSLFLFRLMISLMGLVVMLPLVGGFVLVVLRMVFREQVSVGGVLAAAGLFLAMIAMGTVFWIIGRLTRDFVVPLQFLRRSRCLDAWRELRSGLFPGNIGSFVLYFLFRIVLSIAIAVLVLTVVLATCCLAGCLLVLPYLGTVLLLPILIFDRSYSLHFLAQFGPDYDVFSPPGTGHEAMSQI